MKKMKSKTTKVEAVEAEVVEVGENLTRRDGDTEVALADCWTPMDVNFSDLKVAEVTVRRQYALTGAKTVESGGEVFDVPGDVIERREALFTEATSRRKLEQMWFRFAGGERRRRADGRGARRRDDRHDLRARGHRRARRLRRRLPVKSVDSTERKA